MTKRQFLNELYRRLDALPREEAEQHLTYYAEMLSDRMEDGMTEEEAVAAMEDMDIIVRRILDARGTESVDPSAAVFDDPVGGSGAGMPAKRRRWLIPVVVGVLLVAVALPVAGFFAYNMVCSTPGGIRIDTGDGAVIMDESGLRIEADGEVVSIGPGGIAAYEQVESGPADRISYEVDPSLVNELQVEWISGSVLVQYWDGAVIRMTESFDGAIKSNDKDRFTYSVDRGELKIGFDGRKNHVAPRDKELVVKLPVGMSLSEVDVETASADITVAVTAGEVTVETASGDIRIAASSDRVEADTASGTIRVCCDEGLRTLDADTASGDVYLELEKDMPFSLRFETASGKIGRLGNTLSDLEKTREGWRRGSGGAGLEVETASGDLHLMEKSA